MLHKRQLPEPIANDLRRVFDAKIRFVLWLLLETPALGFGQNELETKFKPALGKWFFDRMNGLATFQTAVLELCAMSRVNPNDAIICADAIKNDIRFDLEWETHDYAMQFPNLPEAWRKALKSVTAPFYESWLYSDTIFEKSVFNLQGEKISRSIIMKSFYDKYDKICSYCDDSLGDVNYKETASYAPEGTEANDCDHFLPKSIFPHLCIHPNNLFPCCKGCNQTWKKDVSPLDDEDNYLLISSYHPQFKPGAFLVNVQTERLTSNRSQVKIKISDEVISKRSIMLNKVMKLEERWSDRVSKRIDAIQSTLCAYITKQIAENQNTTMDFVEKYLEDTEKATKDLIEILDFIIKSERKLVGRKVYLLHDISFYENEKSPRNVKLLAAFYAMENANQLDKHKIFDRLHS